jgi:hypothetical protein
MTSSVDTEDAASRSHRVKHVAMAGLLRRWTENSLQ